MSPRTRRILAVLILLLLGLVALFLVRCHGQTPAETPPALTSTPAVPATTQPAVEPAATPSPAATPAPTKEPEEDLTPATVKAPAQIMAGAAFGVEWTGPNNPGDYITIVAQGTPDGRYDNYAETRQGPSLPLTALIQPGAAELRYMTGQGAKVLARRPIRVIEAQITLEAPAEIVAGAVVPIVWTGPDNRGDYLTIVRQSTPDGQYARYADTSRGSPARVEAPMDAGPAEIRYMSGQGTKVLARRPITVAAPQVTLKAPAKAVAGTTVAVEWTGPNNPGDYFTIVAKSAADGTSNQTVPASRGSPASLRTPAQPGTAEIRYLSGQGNRVLARADLELTPTP